LDPRQVLPSTWSSRTRPMILWGPVWGVPRCLRSRASRRTSKGGVAAVKAATAGIRRAGPRLGVCVGCRCRSAALERETDRPLYPCGAKPRSKDCGLRLPRTTMLKLRSDLCEGLDAVSDVTTFVDARVLVKEPSSESSVCSVNVSGSLIVLSVLRSHQVTEVPLRPGGGIVCCSTPTSEHCHERRERGRQYSDQCCTTDNRAAALHHLRKDDKGLREVACLAGSQDNVVLVLHQVEQLL